MQGRKSKLRREIRTFSKVKLFIAVPLILIGLCGMILPIIPGAVFFIAGLVLIIPSLEKKINT